MPTSMAMQPAILMALLMNITRPFGSESANAPTKGASTDERHDESLLQDGRVPAWRMHLL